MGKDTAKGGALVFYHHVACSSGLVGATVKRLTCHQHPFSRQRGCVDADGTSKQRRQPGSQRNHIRVLGKDPGQEDHNADCMHSPQSLRQFFAASSTPFSCYCILS